jgi:hypothetical protein
MAIIKTSKDFLEEFKATEYCVFVIEFKKEISWCTLYRIIADAEIGLYFKNYQFDGSEK